ncbi:hypothetical protein F7U70_003593 [Vibrio fluvialis]|nr:hypothetical protein [Vibrio fluvialis]MBY7981990.1 hypothetical protein [Vibrio fluvialis]
MILEFFDYSHIHWTLCLQGYLVDWESIFKISAGFLASVGSASAIILGLSSWLGKVWAQRILEQEKNKMAIGLETTKRELDLAKDKLLSHHSDKIAIYRMVIDTVAEILAAFDAHQNRKLSTTEANETLEKFNKDRIRLYGYLGMLAPQSVLDAQDKLVDRLILVANGNADYEWAVVRELVLKLINELRIDIGIDKSAISYNGQL